jgi:hypothetical protein
MRLLDLFAGTHSVGKVARELGYNVVSLDLADASICCNVLVWEYEKFPVGYFDVIWCSPPCETFSIVRRSNVGRNGYTRESLEKDMLECGVPILRKTQEIINYFKPRYWFMENPQTGRMKEFVDASINYYDVDYCKYSDWGYRKRTRIWYGKPVEGFTPLKCNKDCGYVQDNKHLMRATGSAKGENCKGQGGGNNRKPRYRIPSGLIHQILSPLIINDAELCLHEGSG